MNRSSLYNKIYAAVKAWQGEQGCSFSQAMRDTLTDLRHMADNTHLEFAQIDCAAANVYDEEIGLEEAEAERISSDGEAGAWPNRGS